LQPPGAGEIEAPVRLRGAKPALIVVANALNRELLEDELTAGSIPIRHARTGSEALAALRTAALRGVPVGLAVIDHSLPDMTGFHLAHTARAGSTGAELQVIMLAALDQDLRKAEGGGLKLLTKPIRQSALWECIAAGDREKTPTIVSEPKTSAPDKPGRGRAPVLVVEDSPVNLEVSVAILESMGCVVETAVNGRHALERHAAGEFSLIFMDCQMPEMDGFEATMEIRRREILSGRHTPIVALTASVVEDGRQRCLAAGMDDYLAKPFTLEQMRAMLTSWLNPHARPAANDHLSLLAARPSVDEPIDNNVLGSLRRFQQEGRPDIVQAVIELFFKGAPTLLTELDNGAAMGDAALLSRASHALKSASANVGAVVLSARCNELEALAKSGAVAGAARLVDAIRENYRAVEAHLSEQLPRVA
jgi:CheY-like chemotaxis protein/HPt (histidine-containing phosphotransfer) domain-containing protein